MTKITDGDFLPFVLFKQIHKNWLKITSAKKEIKKHNLPTKLTHQHAEKKTSRGFGEITPAAHRVHKNISKSLLPSSSMEETEVMVDPNPFCLAKTRLKTNVTLKHDCVSEHTLCVSSVSHSVWQTQNQSSCKYWGHLINTKQIHWQATKISADMSSPKNTKQEKLLQRNFNQVSKEADLIFQQWLINSS